MKKAYKHIFTDNGKFEEWYSYEAHMCWEQCYRLELIVLTSMLPIPVGEHNFFKELYEDIKKNFPEDCI